MTLIWKTSNRISCTIFISKIYCGYIMSPICQAFISNPGVDLWLKKHHQTFTLVQQGTKNKLIYQVWNSGDKSSCFPWHKITFLKAELFDIKCEKLLNKQYSPDSELIWCLNSGDYILNLSVSFISLIFLNNFLLWFAVQCYSLMERKNGGWEGRKKGGRIDRRMEGQTDITDSKLFQAQDLQHSSSKE